METIEKRELMDIAKNIQLAEERGIDLYISAEFSVIKVSREGLSVIISIKNDCDVDFVEIMRYSAKVFGYLDTAKNIKIIPYYDDLSSIIKVSDLVISRAGASTISEILSLNKPSILIPSPYVANNHQYYNALELKEKGLSYMIEQKDLTTKSLNTAIDYVFTHEKEMITKLKKQPKLDASKLIVEEILK